MIIVNLLPRAAKVCVSVTDKLRQLIVEELHINPRESEVKQLQLTDDNITGQTERTAVSLCDTLLTILETKAAQTIGTPRSGGDWAAVCQWLETLTEPVEIILEFNAVARLQHGLPGSNQPTALTVSTGSCNESVLYDNSGWFDPIERAA